MGVFIPGVLAIIAVVTSAIAVVATFVATIVATVVAAVTAIVAAVTVAVSAVVASVVSLASGIYSAIATVIGPIFTQIQTIAQVIYKGVVWYTHVLADAFAGFLEAIHFKTILQIHKLAELLSKDYRIMMQRIYGRIAKVSEAIGYTSEFLNLAYRNARAVVLSSSGLLGRKYDIAEIGWISQWNRYLKHYGGVMATFRNRPEMIFDTLDQFLLKGSVDSAASAMLAVYQTLDSSLLAIKTLVGQVTDVRDDFGDFIEDLPDFMKKEITPYTDPIIAKFDNFQRQIYKPQLERLDKILNEVGADLTARREEIEDIVDRLKRPGDMFEEMKFLDIDQQLDQEEKIRTTVFHRSRGDTGEFRGIYLPEDAELKKLGEALTREVVPLIGEISEVEAPARPADKPVEPRETWEVGDY